MAARTIEVPSFDYSAFYYPQLFEMLVKFKRQYVPELTDESDVEPFMQLLKAFALVGHLNNTLLDMVANEFSLPTAKLVESVRNQLRLIDYEMKPGIPATTDLIYELNRVITSSTTVVPARARVATENQANGLPVTHFESIDGLVVATATNALSAVLSLQGETWRDFTATANAGGSDFNPWPDGLAVGDAIYFGHQHVMWDTLDVAIANASSSLIGVWEFYDGDWADGQPDSVENLGGGQLEFVLNGLLGTENRSGSVIRVRSLKNGAFEDVVSTWNGTENIVRTTLLSQSTPSLETSDYEVGSEWTELTVDSNSFSDGTDDFTTSGAVVYALPQTEAFDWRKATLNSVEAFWIRYRLVSVSASAAPRIGRCRIDTGKQFCVYRSAIQGRTAEDVPLGSSNGSASQRFKTSRDHFISNSETIEVDNEVWTRVDNFLSSASQDKHYVIELGEKNRATVVFGDGINGKIPPVGQGNIEIVYRYGADADGNVGSNTLTVDKTGLTYANRVYNPRQASGWAEPEGYSEASLARTKIEGPASLRIREVAMGPDDLEEMAVSARNFADSDGRSVFSRASAFEEGFGEKTVELVLVARGGIVPTSQQLLEVEEFFNGNKTTSPRKRKRFVCNQQVVGTAFQIRTIDVVATVHAPASVTVQSIVNRLAEVIQPEALKEDGVTWEWDFNDVVGTSRINHEIFKADKKIELVSVSGADVQLGPRELPKLGTVSLTMVRT